MRSIDVLVIGRHTFEQVLSFGKWPYGNQRVVALSSRPLTLPDALQKTVETASGTPQEIIRWLEKQGTRLFGPLESDVNLLHVETRSLAGGLVQNRYRVQS